MKPKPGFQPVEATKRRPMTKARAKRITDAAGGACYICGDTSGPFDIEHPIQLWMGGKDDDAELRPVCRLTCHKVKSASDAKDRAKVRSLQRSEAGVKPKYHRPIQSRGFDKTVKQKIPSRPLSWKPW